MNSLLPYRVATARNCLSLAKRRPAAVYGRSSAALLPDLGRDRRPGVLPVLPDDRIADEPQAVLPLFHLARLREGDWLADGRFAPAAITASTWREKSIGLTARTAAPISGRSPPPAVRPCRRPAGDRWAACLVRLL
jgi:hypothetical protein